MAAEFKGIAPEEFGNQLKVVLTNISESMNARENDRMDSWEKFSEKLIETMHDREEKLLHIMEAMQARENYHVDRWDKLLEKLECIDEKVERVLRNGNQIDSREVVVDMMVEPPPAPAPAPPPPPKNDQPTNLAKRSPPPIWTKLTSYTNKWVWIMVENGEWLEDMRGNLTMVATLIATMTYQVGLNPPGGVVQNFEKGVVDCPQSTGNLETQACPGESVFASAGGFEYFHFIMFNNMAFFSSLIVCLWLISGLPLHHRFPTWFMALAMCISLTSLAVTYLFGVSFVSPGMALPLYGFDDDRLKSTIQMSTQSAMRFLGQKLSWLTFILAAIISIIFLVRFVILLLSFIRTKFK